MRPVGLWTLAFMIGLAMLGPSVVAQGQKESERQQQVKQIKLTDRQVQSYISAQKQFAPLAAKLEGAGDQPDPALQSQMEQIAKSNGFASLEELDDVATNIALVLDGLDPQTGQFLEPSEQIKKAMDEVRQDGQMPQKDKDQALAEMQEELKSAAPLQFKENVAVVKKYQKELDQVAAARAREAAGTSQEVRCVRLGSRRHHGAAGWPRSTAVWYVNAIQVSMSLRTGGYWLPPALPASGQNLKAETATVANDHENLQALQDRKTRRSPTLPTQRGQPGPPAANMP